MDKSSTVTMSGNEILKQRKLTIGMDLGDRATRYCVLDEAGDVILERSVPTTKKGMDQVFAAMPHSRVALETGAHSPWVSRLLTQLGHEVIVAHARNVRLIGESSRKDDRLDARTLARLARIDPQFIEPGSTPQRGSTSPPDGDPGSSRTGQCAHGSGECRTRVGEVLRRTAAEMWHPASAPRSGRGIERELQAALEPLLERSNH